MSIFEKQKKQVLLSRRKIDEETYDYRDMAIPESSPKDVPVTGYKRKKKSHPAVEDKRRLKDTIKFLKG